MRIVTSLTARLATAAVALACAGLPALADGPATEVAEPGKITADRNSPPTIGKDKRGHVYVLSNTAWTLYHELGHALVDVFDIPVLGREEDAVDDLAVLMMLGEEPSVLRDQMITDAAWYWSYAGAEQEAAGHQPAYWDEHSLNQQRFYRAICIAYGSDPDRFAHLAEVAHLPADMQDTCVWQYEAALSAWQTVLSGHVNAGAPADRITAVYQTPGAAYADVARFVQASAITERIARRLQEFLKLPASLTIEYAECGVANAYYSPDERKVTMCYEELHDFTRQLHRNGAPPDGRR